MNCSGVDPEHNGDDLIHALYTFSSGRRAACSTGATLAAVPLSLSQFPYRLLDTGLSQLLQPPGPAAETAAEAASRVFLFSPRGKSETGPEAAPAPKPSFPGVRPTRR